MPQWGASCQNRQVLRRAFILLAVLGAVACGHDPGGDDDPVDAGDANGGLTLSFKAQPDVPGSAGGDFDVFIGTASVVTKDLRAIGDAAPGDERTRVDSLVLGWTDESEPKPVDFADAPLGLYSQVRAEIVSYTMTGTVKLNDTTYPFEITDTPPVPLSASTTLSGGVTVVAGETTNVELTIRLGEVLKELNWDQLEIEDGTVTLDEGDSEIDDLRDHMLELLED